MLRVKLVRVAVGSPNVGTDERFKEGYVLSCAKIVADNFPEAVTEGLEK